MPANRRLQRLLTIAVVAIEVAGVVDYVGHRVNHHAKSPAALVGPAGQPGSAGEAKGGDQGGRPGVGARASQSSRGPGSNQGQGTWGGAASGTAVGGVAFPPSYNLFSYGFDFTNQAPDAPHTNPNADAAAKGVLSHFSGGVMDMSLYGFGLKNPEPKPGKYDMSGMVRRLSLIQSVGGVPAITLIGAPGWMRRKGSTTALANDQQQPSGGGGKQGKSFFTPPSPAHYQDFANLAAHVAESFPQVKYFVVWNEMKGFYVQKSGWDYTDYTAMYNTVYSAIKRVRPDALIGGPYAALASYAKPKNGKASSVNGSRWGYLDQGMMDTVTYWLQHKVGADFVAVDGSTNVAKQNDPSLADPLSASMKYAAVDQWIRGQTALPIWWMESHIQPDHGWTDVQAAAARIATLAIMDGSGARTGLQWQPQEQPGWPDQGLWTSTNQSGGGQPTTLASKLVAVMPLLRKPLTVMGNTPQGVLVATGPSGTLLVNTLDRPSQVSFRGATVNLAPGQVLVV